jgi:hypothetical protein
MASLKRVGPVVPETVWSKPLSLPKTAAQASKSAWGWGTPRLVQGPKPEPRFSGLRNRFSERPDQGAFAENHPDLPCLANAEPTCN